MKILGKYKNGNYNVVIFDDGTKVRETNDDKFIPEFPECMDVKITNYCDRNCPFCHEASSTSGEHGDILNAKFIDSLNPYTELAIGGGNPLSHPDLMQFLQNLKDKKIIANITINQVHFEQNTELIDELISKDLIKGLGVSLVNPTDEFINKISNYKNAVIHVINGVVKISDLEKMYDKGLKILILGYKQFRKGNDYYSASVEFNKTFMKLKLSEILKHFKVVSFDNLAIEQLEVKNLMSEKEWNDFYMGDDGQFTMYIDMVQKKFTKSSITSERFDLMDNIKDMFKIVKEVE